MALEKRDIKEIRNADGTFAKGNTTGALSHRGKSFTTKVKDAIEAIDEGTQTSAQEEIVKKIVEKMKEGDFNFIKEFWEQTDGKPKQSSEFSGPNGAPIEISSEEKKEVEKAVDDIL